MLKATAVLFKIQGKAIFPCTDFARHYSSAKTLQTRFVSPHKPSTDTFLVIKVIISNDNFISRYTMKKFGARFSFSDFHRQKFSQQQEPDLREKITENMINI